MGKGRAKTTFGNDCGDNAVKLFIDSCTRRGVACTDNPEWSSRCGVQIRFSFDLPRDANPCITSTEVLIEKLGLEFAAQYISSWSRPVFGITQTDVTVGKEQDVFIRLFSELREESFVAAARMGILFDALADLVRQSTLKEAQDSKVPNQSG